MNLEQVESDEVLSKRLVSAICHEIANHLAAVRLQAYLINEESNPRNLASASLVIDDLSARSSALLALVRPVLWDVGMPQGSVRANAIAQGVEGALEEHGGRGVHCGITFEDDLPDVRADPGVMHFLLLLHTYGALEAASAGDRVDVRVEDRDEGVAFIIDESGEVGEGLVNWPKAGLRGRALSCAIADLVLRRTGGWLRIGPNGNGVRSEIGVPHDSSA